MRIHFALVCPQILRLFHFFGTGRCPDDEDAKVPKIKLLPSIKELGPPPKKPPRPPKVDLGAFQQNFPGRVFTWKEMVIRCPELQLFLLK